MLKTKARQLSDVINKKKNSKITLKTTNGNAIANIDCASALNEVFIKRSSCCTLTAYPCFETCQFLFMNSVVIEIDGTVNISYL